MACMQCHYYSSSLKHTVEVNVIVPTPEGNEQITDSNVQKSYCYEKGLPVVYLLHGAFGNYSSFLRFSNIERYVQKHRCVAVMASADNSFYQDMYHGNSYYTFFTKELPAFITNVFPVSKKREDTYIAGFSMGGYGAWYLALSNPDLYSKSASMSGALDIVDLYSEYLKGTMDAPFPLEDIFAEPQNLSGSNFDLFELHKQCMAKGQVPELYQACGTEDFLYSMNQTVKSRLEQVGANLIYEEGSGGHNWDFWDEYIKKVLNWMFNK
ncbi:S-formylglutathione hydrolase FrmB [Lachnotalea glycerini]|uniref:S-formylglutathione hydrolase FrmB n=1 Tax=Lachnotalea glycerini TaxID=1763509 RepID=A0A318EI81_9FIRM|nr:alpha/beta hydrolase family protein [Lachnotalea glycerini]OYO42784.1 tributyrin esterase [Lachnotalea glycerini]PXV86669.1 S-formylglutathione hydrolase FrmB [Lachnotalea glycerini]